MCKQTAWLYLQLINIPLKQMYPWTVLCERHSFTHRDRWRKINQHINKAYSQRNTWGFEKEKRTRAAPMRPELSCMECCMGANGTEGTREALKESQQRKKENYSLLSIKTGESRGCVDYSFCSLQYGEMNRNFPRSQWFIEGIKVGGSG